MTIVVVQVEGAGGSSTCITSTDPGGWVAVFDQIRGALHCDPELPPATSVAVTLAGTVLARVPDDRHWTTVARDVRALLDRGER